LPYPHPYLHKFRVICGLTNSPSFNPLDKVLCFERTADQQHYRIATLRAVLQAKTGKDRDFEKHVTSLARN